MLAQLLEVAKLGAMFPIYSTIYIMAPTSRMGLFMKKPFVKFICHSTSYAFFLSKATRYETLREKLKFDFIYVDLITRGARRFLIDSRTRVLWE